MSATDALSSKQWGTHYNIEVRDARDVGRTEYESTRDLHPSEKLVTVQTALHRPAFMDYWRGKHSDGMPVVVRHKGENWINDGHHRIAAARARGESIRVEQHRKAGR